ncbi:hypothetical protein L915_02632 [Phytophthora nicotianae]|uniref:BZIP domain-containing protein n=1 Tax=Phytophthora nicotianae TaxID=4792 RepID=W2HG94_PHYNI|nr:hypothetical protein L915_02632 [Phytophthora nicotianae]ETL37449.1 hypothetical protein L916_10869 [Phytophthora nicotianae]
MTHSTLSPPNINRLGDSVIGGVVQRTRPVYNRTFAMDKTSPDRQNQTISMPCFKALTRTPIVSSRISQESTSTMDLKSISELLAEAKIELRRQQRRVNTARYRKRQTVKAIKLEEDIRSLHEGVDELELQRRLIAAGVPLTNTLWNVAAEYFRLFRNGYMPAVSVSNKFTNNYNGDKNGSYVQQDFLRDTTSPNIVCGGVVGVEALLEHWRATSSYFPDIEVGLVRLEQKYRGMLLATTRTKFTITEHSLRRCFPHLINYRDMWTKLLNQQLVIRGEVCFKWEADNHCVIELLQRGDLLTPVLKLVGSLEDVALVFDKAGISPECQLQ